MKQPSEVKKFCKRCSTHSVQKVTKYKKGKARANTWINRQSARYGKRGCRGKFNKVVKKSFKNAKRAVFNLVCSTCQLKSNFVKPRAKRIQIKKI